MKRKNIYSIPLLAALALALALPACDSSTSRSDQAGTSAPDDKIVGSRKGDFGPPQGEPVNAVLTSPPMVPPATGHRPHRAR